MFKIYNQEKQRAGTNTLSMQDIKRKGNELQDQIHYRSQLTSNQTEIMFMTLPCFEKKYFWFLLDKLINRKLIKYLILNLFLSQDLKFGKLQVSLVQEVNANFIWAGRTQMNKVKEKIKIFVCILLYQSFQIFFIFFSGWNIAPLEMFNVWFDNPHSPLFYSHSGVCWHINDLSV